MGTNYYIHQNQCEHCGRSDPPIHVGKSSLGWKFSFNATERKTLDAWVEFLRKNEGSMQDEYGRPVSTDELLELIEAKKDGISSQGEVPGEWTSGSCRFIPGEYS